MEQNRHVEGPTIWDENDVDHLKVIYETFMDAVVQPRVHKVPERKAALNGKYEIYGKTKNSGSEGNLYLSIMVDSNKIIKYQIDFLEDSELELILDLQNKKDVSPISHLETSSNIAAYTGFGKDKITSLQWNNYKKNGSSLKVMGHLYEALRNNLDLSSALVRKEEFYGTSRKIVPLEVEIATRATNYATQNPN